MDMPRPAAAHALKSRSERQRRGGQGLQSHREGSRGALYSAYCCDGVLRLCSCNPLQLHPAVQRERHGFRAAHELFIVMAVRLRLW